MLLAHISGSGLLVAAAATDALAVHTTGLLGKVRVRHESEKDKKICLASRTRCRPPNVSSLPLSLRTLQRSDGTIDPVRFALLWPYHFSLRAKLALQRKYSSEPSFNQVTPDYFIGAWPSEQKLVPTVRLLPGWNAGNDAAEQCGCFAA